MNSYTQAARFWISLLNDLKRSAVLSCFLLETADGLDIPQCVCQTHSAFLTQLHGVQTWGAHVNIEKQKQEKTHRLTFSIDNHKSTVGLRLD